jgi:hypothetical protein
VAAQSRLVEGPDRLEVRSPMRTGMRVVFALLGLVPLLAPYELLVRIDWQGYLNPFFAFAAVVSLGAMAVSAFLFSAAVAGLSSVMTFDRGTSTFTHTFWAPVVRRIRRGYPLSAVGEVGVGVTEWSEGAPTFHIRVTLIDGTVVESGSSWSRAEIETMTDRVNRFLEGGARPGQVR